MKLVEDLLSLDKLTRQQHLKLNEPCLERGGDSVQHRGILAQFLDTNMPKGHKVHLCHACHNGKCSNPRHLYWGTPKENREDAIVAGNKTIWQSMVEKYGLEEATKRQSSNAAKMNDVLRSEGRLGNPGVPKSEEHRRNISEALKKKKRV